MLDKYNYKYYEYVINRAIIIASPGPARDWFGSPLPEKSRNKL